jgi:hypothetical protein
MATINIDNFISMGVDIPHTATSWRVSLDKAGQEIIDQSLNDPYNIKSWQTPLPKIGSTNPNEYYSDLTIAYAHIKIHMGDVESKWFTIAPWNHDKQMITVKYVNGKIVIYENKPRILPYTQVVKVTKGKFTLDYRPFITGVIRNPDGSDSNVWLTNDMAFVLKDSDEVEAVPTFNIGTFVHVDGIEGDLKADIDGTFTATYHIEEPFYKSIEDDSADLDTIGMTTSICNKL